MNHNNISVEFDAHVVISQYAGPDGSPVYHMEIDIDGMPDGMDLPVQMAEQMISSVHRRIEQDA